MEKKLKIRMWLEEKFGEKRVSENWDMLRELNCKIADEHYHAGMEAMLDSLVNSQSISVTLYERIRKDFNEEKNKR